MSTRIFVIPGAVLALVAGLLGFSTAGATAAGRVGMVSVTSVTTNSISLVWPRYKRAATYRVLSGTNYGVSKNVRTKKTRTNRVKISGLRAGREYCFKVRAFNRKGKHIATSRRTCKPAAAVGLPKRGATVSTLTYNICSKACDTDMSLALKGFRKWSVRRPVITRTILRSGADVVALQEASGWSTVTSDVRSVYTPVLEFGDRPYAGLLYRTSRFEQVTDTVTGDFYGQPWTTEVPRSATINLPNQRRATWTQLRDKRTGKSVIYVSVHLGPEVTARGNAQRRTELTTLMRHLAVANVDRVPVVYLGDFNSNKSRGHRQDTPARVMEAVQYVDAYDQAFRLSRPNYNSGTNGSVKPVFSYTYGDHIDKVWIRKGDGIGVLSWANINPRRGNRYATPMGSDHSPILVKLRVS